MKRSLSILLTVILVCASLPAHAEAATKKKARGVMDVPFYETELSKDREFLYNVNLHNVQTGGGYGYNWDNDTYAKYLQEKISTVSEFMFWLYISDYHYDEIEGMMGYVRDGWSVSNSPELCIDVGFGVCCETSTVLAYMLADDYEEVGFVLITGDYGHQYNYIKDGGKYYFVDFTDFTSNKNGNVEMEDIWKQWKDDICFWSGKSLGSKAAKKAACKHDNYDWENNGSGRAKYDLNWNKKHTAAILTVPCYDGMYVPPSTYRDDCYQFLERGVEINGQNYYLNQICIGFQEDIIKDIHTLFINSDYQNAKWKVIGIPVREIPWYCNVVPGTDPEDIYEKAKRQTTDSRGDFRYYDYFGDEERGIRRGLFLKLMNLAHSNELRSMTPEQICKKYNLRTKY